MSPPLGIPNRSEYNSSLPPPSPPRAPPRAPPLTPPHTPPSPSSLPPAPRSSPPHCRYIAAAIAAARAVIAVISATRAVSSPSTTSFFFPCRSPATKQRDRQIAFGDRSRRSIPPSPDRISCLFSSFFFFVFRFAFVAESPKNRVRPIEQKT